MPMRPPPLHVRPTAVAIAGALAISAAACSSGGAQEGARVGVPPATALCGEVEFPEMQFGSHLIGDAEPPIPYSSTPPTSGWHSSGAPPVGIHDEPLSEPQQVSTLEAGGVVVTHNGLAEGELDRLVEAVADGALAEQVVVTPYPRLDAGTVAFTSWGAVQRCDGLDVDALTAYAEAYGNPITDHG